MTGNRKPKQSEGRFNPENPDPRQEDGSEDEEEDADDGVEEDDTGASTGSSGTPGTPAGTPPDSPLTNEIRRVRADNQRLESQLAGYEPQIAAAKSMQLQFTEAVDTIQACMNRIKQNMTAMQKAHFSNWAENRMSEITREQTLYTEPGAGTSAGSGSGYELERDEEDFKTIKDRFDKLKRLIAIREEAEAGGSIEFSEASREEIAELACRGGASGPRDNTNEGGVRNASGDEAVEDKITEEISTETNTPGDGVRSEDAESGGED